MRPTSRRPRLAPSLLLAGVAGAGCLIVTPDHYFVNQPPRVVEQYSEPREPEVFLTAEQACAPLLFSVRVEDPDLGDPIRYRWYVDAVYQADGPPLRHPSPEAVRQEEVAWTVRPLAPGSPLAAPGTHLVEVLVADGEFSGREPQPRRPWADGGDPSFADTRTWVVHMPSGVTCPD